MREDFLKSIIFIFAFGFLTNASADIGADFLECYANKQYVETTIYVDNYQTLSQAELFAIFGYTTGDFGYINPPLWGGTEYSDSCHKTQFALIMSALTKLSLPEGIVPDEQGYLKVYRGANSNSPVIPKSLKKGDTLVLNGFVSTALSKIDPTYPDEDTGLSTAEGFTNESNGATRRIFEIKTFSGKSVFEISNAGGEGEILIPHGKSFELEEDIKVIEDYKMWTGEGPITTKVEWVKLKEIKN